MTSINWYLMTHDNTGSRYGWIIGKEHGKEFTVYCKGFTLEDFMSAAEFALTGCNDPSSFLVINPYKKGTAYKLADVYASAKKSIA